MVWSDVMAWVALVPPTVWIAAVVGNVVLTAATWSVARGRVRRAGQRVANAAVVAPGGAKKDTALTVASLVPAGLFWVMVLAGSFHGLVSFGRSTLGWRNGWEYLVPGTLDGVSVTFAMLAFRAVRKGKTPDRCYRVVWGAALASATINFSYEYGKSGNALAGGYVGLLSLFGMVMFDEFLNQFEQGTDTVRRENPKFGVRWVTWPSNTFLAAVAWRNHPPSEGTAGTVVNAVANLNRVRELKRSTRRNRQARPAGDGPPLADAVRSLRGPGVQPSAEVARRPVGVVARTSRPARGGRRGEDDVPVPVTRGKVAQWAQTWIAMCDNPDAAEGALKDDQIARMQFGCTARQLRHIRYAVSTGALRRRASELAVALPERFDDLFPPS